MYNNFIQRLKHIKEELLALKTAHAQGLGSANFDSLSDEYNFDSVGGDNIFRVRVVYNENQSDVPYCQCYISNAQYFQPVDVSWESSSRTMTFEYECYVNNVSLSGVVKVVSNGSINNLYTE